MSRLRTLVATAVVAVACLPPIATVLCLGSEPARAEAEAEISVDVFDEPLAEDGDWIDHPRYGRVWYPRDVDVDWRPYSVGRWAHTEEHGWLWESEERWGWATYHYGRWDYDPRYGWIWIPGTTWAPAWVEWRTGGGYIGWAPLTPAASWRDNRIVHAERIDHTSPRWRPFWVFVSEPLFVRPGLHRHCEPPVRNVTIVRDTTIVTNYSTSIGNTNAVVNRSIVNNSISVKYIERVTSRPVETASLRRVTSPAERKFGQPNIVAIYRPAGSPIRQGTSAGQPPGPGPASVTEGSPTASKAGAPAAAVAVGAAAIGAAAVGVAVSRPTGPGSARRPPPAAGPGGPPAAATGAATAAKPLPAAASVSPVAPAVSVAPSTPPPPQQPVSAPPALALPPQATPPPATVDAARKDTARQRPNADRDAPRQSQEPLRTAAPTGQPPGITRDQVRERGEQRRPQEQPRDVVVTRPPAPPVPPPQQATPRPATVAAPPALRVAPPPQPPPQTAPRPAPVAAPPRASPPQQPPPQIAPRPAPVAAPPPRPPAPPPPPPRPAAAAAPPPQRVAPPPAQQPQQRKPQPPGQPEPRPQ